MTLDLSLIEHPQVQNASLPIGCLKELLNYHYRSLMAGLSLNNYYFWECATCHYFTSLDP
jgi:hypothetical protein